MNKLLERWKIYFYVFNLSCVRNIFWIFQLQMPIFPLIMIAQQKIKQFWASREYTFPTILNKIFFIKYLKMVWNRYKGSYVYIYLCTNRYNFKNQILNRIIRNTIFKLSKYINMPLYYILSIKSLRYHN